MLEFLFHSSRRFLACLRQLFCLYQTFLVCPLISFLKRIQLFRTIVDKTQLASDFLLEFIQFFYRTEVILLLQSIQSIQPAVDFLQQGRIELNLLSSPIDFIGDIFDFYIGTFHTRSQFPSWRIYRFYRIQIGSDVLQDRRHIVVFVSQHVIRIKEHLLYLFSMSQHLTVLFQLLLLAFFEFILGQLLILETQKIFILPISFYLLCQVIQLTLALFLLLVCLGKRTTHLAVLGHHVHNAEHKIILLQEQVLVLAVYVYQVLAQFLENSNRYW